ncbi:MAG: GNAT family N-acetyltransferase [Saprospiraceae bacterium]|nr:GNAT family N-acetyltransferase [Saprospiraceae bacterium]
MMPMDIRIRPIRSSDNEAMAGIIRQVMTSYGLVGEGYSIMDPEVDHIADIYTTPSSAYWVLESGDTILGGGGFGPLAGGERYQCEVKKMYFMPALRGMGWGGRLLEKILDEARKTGYTYAYIETVHQLKEANHLYRKYHFEPLDGPMGQTGHGACDAWYGLELVR